MKITSVIKNHIPSIILKMFLLCISIGLTVLFCEFSFRFYLKNSNSTFHDPINNGLISNDSQFISYINTKHIRPDNFNIYYFGESTMKGYPSQYMDIIPIIIEKMLNSNVDNKQISWVNLSEWGIDLDVTKTRIQWLINNKNTLTYPSLIVIYSGHNEFIKYQNSWGFSYNKYYSTYLNWIIEKSTLAKFIAEKLKLYKLDIDERTFFDIPAFSKTQLNQTLTNYKQQIQHIIALANESRIPIIISTTVGNYADFEPNRSVFCTHDNNQMKTFKTIMDNGAEAAKQARFQDALMHYQNALSICNSFAETDYQIGKTYEAIGDYVNAQKSFENAADNDKMPIRSTTEENDIIRNIQQNRYTTIVDTISNFRDRSENGLIGYNLMADVHHPNLKGYLLLSAQIANTILDKFSINHGITQLSESDVRQMFLNDNDKRYLLNQEESEWFIRMATWRFDPEQRLKKAEQYLDQAVAINSKKASSYLDRMAIYYIRKENTKAKDEYQKALKLDSVYTEKFLLNPWIKQIMLRAQKNN